mmetsp:Transcript_85999/g.170725  ORF Transcript_85999/g.170725 Transcript_85999/m.170725 type:complete len:764 (-) Transcript_85999:269-2560(-)
MFSSFRELLPSPFQGIAACTEVITKLRSEGNEVPEEYPTEGHEHVFTFYDELTEEGQKQLHADFESIRVDEVEEAFNVALESRNVVAEGDSMEAPYVMSWDLKNPPMPRKGANVTVLADVPESRKRTWYNLGLDLYHQSMTAIVLLSGGLDTRLHKGVPKGVLDIGLLSRKTIFQLLCERILRLQHLVQRKFGRCGTIPLYIMCNSLNRNMIEDFFHENANFGIHEHDILFFTQGNIPVMNKQGKFLLQEKHRIAQEPHGNGGVFQALVREGMISDMKSRGVTAMYICSIDNVLTKVGDPTFIGYCEACKTDVGIKVVERILPEESLGLFGTKVYRNALEDLDGDGRFEEVNKIKAAVVEYFELPEDVRRRQKQASSGMPGLDMNAANISQYYFKVDFAKRHHSFVGKRWHAIHRAVPYINIKTGEVVPTPKDGSKNAIRLEMFIFDIFESAKNVCGLQVSRNEYAVVNSHIGPNSMRSAVQAVGHLHQHWITAAGGKFLEKSLASERAEFTCEISPLVSYDGEDLSGQFPRPVTLPFYLPSQKELAQFSVASVDQPSTGSMHFLDMECNLVQHEQDVTLQFHLGEAMRRIEDKAKVNYAGESAMENEVLPATPRRPASRTASRTSSSFQSSFHSSPGSSPRSLRVSPRFDGGDGEGGVENAQVAVAEAAAEGDGAILAEWVELPKEMLLVNLEPKKTKFSSAPKMKPGTKDRFATWGTPSDKLPDSPGSSRGSSPTASPKKSTRKSRSPAKKLKSVQQEEEG